MRLALSLTAGVLLAAATVATTANVASARTDSIAGVYAFNNCRHATARDLTLLPGGRYRSGWASGRWSRKGNIVVIRWALRKEHAKKVRTGRKSGVLRYRVLRTKTGAYALRHVRGGELMHRCKRLA